MFTLWQEVPRYYKRESFCRLSLTRFFIYHLLVDHTEKWMNHKNLPKLQQCIPDYGYHYVIICSLLKTA